MQTIILLSISAVISGLIADRKGYHFILWALIGFFSGPFGIIGVLILPKRRSLPRIRKTASAIPEAVRHSQERIAAQERELRQLPQDVPETRRRSSMASAHGLHGLPFTAIGRAP